MQLTSPAGASGTLHPLPAVAPQLWPAPVPAHTPLYVSATLKLVPSQEGRGPLQWLGARLRTPGVGRIQLTFLVDPDRRFTTTLLMDESGTAVALQGDDAGNVTTASLLADGTGRTASVATGVPLWQPQWVDRYVYANVALTKLPPEASQPFKEAVGALMSAGSVVLPQPTAPVRAFAERYTTRDERAGARPLSVELTLRRPSDCRSGRECTSALADQTLVLVERSDEPAGFTRRYRLSGAGLVDAGGRPYSGLAAYVEVHVERLPDTLFSPECRALLEGSGPVDAGALQEACPAEALAPADRLAFAPLRDALAAARQPLPDREARALALVALEQRAAVCGTGPSGWPAEGAVCHAARGLLDRTRKEDPTLAELVSALRRYREALARLDNVDLTGADPCGAFALHDAGEREAEAALAAAEAVRGSGCLVAHADAVPVRCRDLPSAQELSGRYRQRRQTVAERCAVDRLAHAELPGAPDQAVARDYVVQAAGLADPEWATMVPRADQPLGGEPPERVVQALRAVMDPGGQLPPSPRLEQLLARARRKLEALTLDYDAAQRSYRAFLTSIDVEGIQALASQVQSLTEARGKRPQWLKDLLRDADRLAGLRLADLFEGAKDAYKVRGNWEELRGRSNAVRTLLATALHELAPPAVPVEPGAGPLPSQLGPSVGLQ